MELTELTAIPLTMALVALVKNMDIIPDKYMPIVSLTFGVLLSLLVFPDLKTAAIKGIFYGLSASGLYSGQKSVRGL